MSLNQSIKNFLSKKLESSKYTNDILNDSKIKEELFARFSSDNLPDLKLITPTFSSPKMLKLSEQSQSDESLSEEKITEQDSTEIAEAIIRTTGRPVLFVRNDTFEKPESEVWQERLEKARDALEFAIKAVGRVELRNNPTYDWVGTAWLVAPDIVVTNRHVANVFAIKQGNDFVFRANASRQFMRSDINFKVEYQMPDVAEFKVREILYIEEDIQNPDGSGSPDIAFLRISEMGDAENPLATPISLSKNLVESGRNVAVIGYPARDSRNESSVMDRIFSNVYNVKRLHPGQIIGVTSNVITHDCSTLGGNSGSVVLDLNTGEAVGLHFGGSYRRQNYAVPASIIKERLNKFL